MIWRNLVKQNNKSSRQKFTQIFLDEIEINVVQKSVRNLRLTVKAPKGEVRLSAPSRMKLELIKYFLSSKKNWIKEQQNKIRARHQDQYLNCVSNECHRLFGENYILMVSPSEKRSGSKINHKTIELKVKNYQLKSERIKVLNNLYRKELEKVIRDYIDKWQPIMKVKVSSFGIKKMNTRWGTCNTRSKKIWLSLELAKKIPICLEYVIVHEMTHLLEPSHNKRFYSLMDSFMPEWRRYEKHLAE